MNNKRQLVENLQHELGRWEELLASLSEAQLTAPLLPQNWSIKDVVAHLRAWQQRSIARLEAGLQNRAPEYPAWPAQYDPEEQGQPHELNAWLYEQSRDQPWASVYRDWRAGFLRFVELAASIPENDLLDANRYRWMEGQPLASSLQGSWEHHQEHAEYLAPVLAQLHEPGNLASAEANR